MTPTCLPVLAIWYSIPEDMLGSPTTCAKARHTRASSWSFSDRTESHPMVPMAHRSHPLRAVAFWVEGTELPSIHTARYGQVTLAGARLSVLFAFRQRTGTEAFRHSRHRAYRSLDPMVTKAVPSEYREWRQTPRATSGSPATEPTAFTFFSAAIRIKPYFIKSILEVSRSVW
jgi:hypothetical protein